MGSKASLKAFLLTVGTFVVVVGGWMALCVLAGIDQEHTRLCKLFAVLGGSLLATRVSLRVKHVKVAVPPLLDAVAWIITLVPPAIVFLDQLKVFDQLEL
jgi:hypothetical protein